MQVSCPQCSAEYELAPRQISEDGVKIRCASCAHIFKAVAEPQKSQGPWTLRHPTGATIQVADMSKVQLWIVEKKVFEHDQIKEGQAPWMSVADHPLLTSFFGSASQRTLTPAEEVDALLDKRLSKYDSDNFGDTLNLEPVSPQELMATEEPILLTTPKRKTIEPPLEMSDVTQSRTLISHTTDMNPIFTLSGANETIFSSIQSTLGFSGTAPANPALPNVKIPPSSASNQ